ncbi:hypothetical protein VC34_28510 [Pseudomonas fluorescens]|uniref:Uncharacterized protein n=1 Tax=Pseudomonas fluorescens TaxID=294 RepID=A0A0F4SQR2_PSEFL|nr:hypothetical protein VC34_28510 [Pseudomonas fluorescens]
MQNLQTLEIYCGSELARDSGLTVTINPNISPLIQKRRFHPRQKRQRPVPQRKSVHEQGDQDDDRDRYAEKEQQ